MRILKIIAASGAVAVIALAGCSSNSNMRNNTASGGYSSSSNPQPTTSYASGSCQTPDFNVGCNSPGNY